VTWSFSRWLFAPAPPTRLAMLRILVGAFALSFVVSRSTHLWSTVDLPRRQFEPVGVLAWLSDPLPKSFVRLLIIAAIPLGVAFIAGVRFRVIGPLFALVFLVVSTYRLSWGHVIHTEHLVALHLLVVGFVPSADAWSLDARRRGHVGDAVPAPAERYSWPVQVMALVTITAYVLAGIAKVQNGGAAWLVGDVLRNQVAYDNLRKELLGSWHSPVGGWSVQFAWLFPPMALATVLVELGAPVAMLGGKWRTAWVALAWAFHVGIAVLMWISFPYQLIGLAYAPLFRVERIWDWMRERPERPRQRAASASA
jgi:hypothetical protein